MHCTSEPVTARKRPPLDFEAAKQAFDSAKARSLQLAGERSNFPLQHCRIGRTIGSTTRVNPVGKQQPSSVHIHAQGYEFLYCSINVRVNRHAPASVCNVGGRATEPQMFDDCDTQHFKCRA